MSILVPSIHHHILFHRHGFGLNLNHQFPNYREYPNVCNSYGTTPLHILCLDNYGIKVAEELIKRGARVNATNHLGSTPLHFAVIHRNQCMVYFLLENGADVNRQDMNGNTALHFAVKDSGTLLYLPEHQTGDLGIVKKLINNGADIETFNKDYETPLMWAVIEGNLSIVKKLLKFGANVNARKTGLETCLHLASRNVKLNSDILVELVKHGACINCRNQDGKTSLDLFLQSRYPDYGFEKAKTLIKVGTLVNFEHEMDFRIAKEFPILNEFIRKCSEEVLGMKSIIYFEKFSLCHFTLDDNLPGESIFDEVLATLASCDFPIYHDLIMVNFKTSHFRQKLVELDIYARNERVNAIVFLNPDVISEISGFLSDKDLFNFIRAYTKSFVPRDDV